MLKRDSQRVELLRGLISALKYSAIDAGADLSDEQAVKILQKEAKKRQEAIELYRQGGRPELADKEAQELEMIQHYLPEQLSEQAVKQLIQQVIAETGKPDKPGQLVGQVIQRARQSNKLVDGSLVNRLVQQALSE